MKFTRIAGLIKTSNLKAVPPAFYGYDISLLKTYFKINMVFIIFNKIIKNYKKFILLLYLQSKILFDTIIALDLRRT